MAYVGSLDQGTTSTRFIIFDATQSPVASHHVEHRQHTPHPGWLEHDADEILQNSWTCMVEAIRKLKESKGKGATVAAIGVTNQRETTVAWSASTGRPLCRAIVWSDARTQATVNQVCSERGGVDFAREVCGLPVSTYFSALKMRWMLDNIPAVKAANDTGDLRFGTIDSWLIWALANRETGSNDGDQQRNNNVKRPNIHVTDVTNASRTMLMSLKTLDWDDGLCAAFGVKKSSLPRIISCSERIATIQLKSGNGGTDEIPVTGCIGDQQGALVGQRCFRAGMAKNTFGTGCFLLTNVGTAVPPASKCGLLVTVGFKFGASGQCYYALEGAVAGAGSTVQWLKDNMGFIASAHESEAVASTVPDTGGVVFVPAFGGLLAPHWRPDARGTIVGLTQHTKKAHIVRATLEAVTQQVTQLVVAMETDSGIKCTELAVDGNMTKNRLLMQMQADSLGKPICVPSMPEVTALGAAICASLVGNVWGDVATLMSSAQTSTITKIVPKSTAAERVAKQRAWDEGIKRSLGWAKL